MSRYRQPYSLYKRGKYWYYRTYSPGGKRTTAKSTGQISKAGAKAYCDKLYLIGKLYNSDVTFAQYAAHFYDDDALYFKDRVKPLADNTVKQYQKLFKNQIFPYFENKRMMDITYTQLKAFRTFLINSGCSAMSIQSIMSTLKHIMDSAYRDGVIPDNPFNKLESLRFDKNRRDAFRLEEIIFIYKNILPEFKKTILLMALTGIRISEAVGLTVEDIKQGDGFIYIDLQKQMINKKYQILKNDEKRCIPIIPEIKELIGFDSTRVSAFYRYFEPLKKQCENYNERQLAFHSLRHFFITDSKAKGVNNVKVEVLAGHSLKGMEDVYTNFKAPDLVDILPWQKETFLKITE